MIIPQLNWMSVFRSVANKNIIEGVMRTVKGKRFSPLVKPNYKGSSYNFALNPIQVRPFRTPSADFSYSTAKEGSRFIELAHMKGAIDKDLRESFPNYTAIRQSLIHHITRQNYNAGNLSELVGILGLVGGYPRFQLPRETLLLVYRIVCFNMQWRSVEEMNQLLQFVLVGEEAAQSPIFHEFLRFYLHLPQEEYKFKYQLDLHALSLYQALRQLVGRVVQRGFMGRSPPYERNLNVLHRERTIFLLHRNREVGSTLMVKKINYALFLEIKDFYEQQMGENLYHPRKEQLLARFSRDYMQVLSSRVEMIHHEALHLRELYMKLYLTLPQHHTPLSAFKYRNVVDLYWFSRAHLESIDHLGLDEVGENIDVVIEFVKMVEGNMAQLLQMTQHEQCQLGLQFDEVLLIILLLLTQGHTPQQCSPLLSVVLPKVNAYTFWHFHQLTCKVIKHYCSTGLIKELLSNQSIYELLSLQQLSSFLQLFKLSTPPQITNYSIVVAHILAQVLATDFTTMGGKQAICLLKVYEAYLRIPGKGEEVRGNSEALRVFLMRYISDHHLQFSIQQLEKALVILGRMPGQTLRDFNDEGQNYGLSLQEQLRGYLGKVKLVLGGEGREVAERWTQ